MSKQVCIYCWRDQNSVAFSLEHIIPQSIHGRLVLTDHVCVDCNAWLGTHVDHHILRVKDILAAQLLFADQRSHDRVLKHNYDVNLVSETGAEFLAHASGHKVDLLPQKHPIHGMIYPESSIRESLHKSLNRKLCGKIPSRDIDNEFLRMCNWMEAASPGEEFHSPLLESGFRKHSENLRAIVQPKAKPNIRPLIAKIAYEFIFIVGYKRLFATDGLATQLLQVITDHPDGAKTLIVRIEGKFHELKSFHFIRFCRFYNYTRVDVGFYGSINYMLLLTNSLPDDFFLNLSTHFSFPNMVGMQYEHNFSRKTHDFWALGKGKSAKHLKRK